MNGEQAGVLTRRTSNVELTRTVVLPWPTLGVTSEKFFSLCSLAIPLQTSGCSPSNTT